MTDQFIGEIRMFGGQYAPEGWAFCDGQWLEVSGNEALFSLLGTTYGGDGHSSFALPDMRGRLPLGQGQLPGYSHYGIGTRLGQEEVHLTADQMPEHTHSMQAADATADTSAPAGAAPAKGTAKPIYHEKPADPSGEAVMAGDAVGSSGGDQSHHNMMPYGVISFIIALRGHYPPRS